MVIARNLTRVQLHAAIQSYLMQISNNKNKNTFSEVTLPLRDYNQYFELMRTYEICSNDVCLTAIVYIARLVGEGELLISPDNIEAIYTAALLISNKYHEDIPFDNKTFSRLADIYLHELNAIELKIVLALRWNLTVSQDELDHVHQTMFIIHQQSVLQNGLPEGFEATISSS